MDNALRPHPDIHVFPSYVPLPGEGFLPVNAFLLLSKEPVLVDTGLAFESQAFVDAVQAVIDPSEIRWVWLSHDDADHTGSIERILTLAPNARLATNAMCALRMSTVWPVPMNRLYAINPGERLDVGDRTLVAAMPPLFDNPLSTGFYDEKTGVFFSVDSFGAVVTAPAERAEDIPADQLRMGMVAWATSDSPWAHLVDPNKYGQVLNKVRKLEPSMILSSHLPPAAGGSTESFLEGLASVPDAEPFRAPNQMELEQMLSQMEQPSNG